MNLQGALAGFERLCDFLSESGGFIHYKSAWPSLRDVEDALRPIGPRVPGDFYKTEEELGP